jgi:hypothetical protein
MPSDMSIAEPIETSRAVGASEARAAPRRRPGWVVRLARVVALAVIIGIGINHIYWSIADWHLKDMNAYWDAGLRLRAGGPLFPPVTDVLASEVYRYSPWFAWLWVPLTGLPREVVNVAWSIVLLAASFAAMTPLARGGQWLGVAFFLPILIGISAGGNVHALLIAALVLSVERRSGPLWIAIAASLKLFPILFVLTYVGRREWLRAAATIAITGLFLVPFLLYDLSNYVTSAGPAELLIEWPVVYAVAVIGAIAASLWLARTRYAWLASSTAVLLALPRSFLYDVTWLAVAVPSSTAGWRGKEPTAEAGMRSESSTPATAPNP